MVQFEIRARDGLARIGRLETGHGIVRTPLLMPVVHPGKSAITPSLLRSQFGFQMVITNSYIINSNERFREKALAEGVHGLLEFDGPIMTDSGTFQMYFHDLSENEIDPVGIVEFQKNIKTDIGTILDVFSDPDVAKSQVEHDVRVSLERASVSAPLKDKMMMAGTVQGGVFPDLREQSAKGLAAMDFDVHPIGGVVPLMERYRYSDIVRSVLSAKRHLPPNRPIHLFGCGHPMFFAQAAFLGCDLFDSASYAKFAEAGRMMLPTGTVHLDEITESPCSCPVCSMHSIEYLRSLPKERCDLELMRHNLYVASAEMRAVRQAITENKLFELVAQRARSHPSLLDALSTTMEYSELIDEGDTVGKTSSIFYTGPETIKRPEIKRFHARVVERYPYRLTKDVVIIPDDARRPFFDTLSTIIQKVKRCSSSQVLLLFLTPMGVVPWELEHVHPAQQCIFPDRLSSEVLESSQEKLQEILELLDYERLLWFQKSTSLDFLTHNMDGLISSKAQSAGELMDMMSRHEASNEEWTKRKLRAVLAFQWGQAAATLADLKDLNSDISRATGKIRHVRQDGTLLFTMVPTTGLLIPTFEGGKRLLKAGLENRYLVRIDDEVAEFVEAGKSALARFVRGASQDLRAGEEVLVTNEKGSLLGVGRSLLSGTEMLCFDRGVAVSIRHSKKH